MPSTHRATAGRRVKRLAVKRRALLVTHTRPLDATREVEFADRGRRTLPF
jgi:hypothetical protein